MSGGHFDYKQFCLQDIIEELDFLIKTNEIKDEFGYAREYPKGVLDDMKNTINLLKETFIYVHRLDYLICGDDSIDSYYKRLEEELSE